MYLFPDPRVVGLRPTDVDLTFVRVSPEEGETSILSLCDIKYVISFSCDTSSF